MLLLHVARIQRFPTFFFFTLTHFKTSLKQSHKYWEGKEDTVRLTTSVSTCPSRDQLTFWVAIYRLRTPDVAASRKYYCISIYPSGGHSAPTFFTHIYFFYAVVKLSKRVATLL